MIESQEELSKKKSILEYIKNLDFYSNIKLPPELKKNIKKIYLRNYSSKSTCRLVHKVIDSVAIEKMQEVNLQTKKEYKENFTFH